MAVYTKIQIQDINFIFQQFNGIKSLTGIVEGVENTNYLIITNDKKKFIFTIFEKRTKNSDLPFFHKAMNEFSSNGINCPIPIIINNNDIFNVKEKPCAVYSFVEGHQISSANDLSMVSLGKNISKIHNVGIQSKLQRKNDMLALSSWDYILEKFKHYDGKSKSEITHVTNTIKNLSDKFPRSLRTSLIHGDLFRDNIFFQNNEVSGFIDFFFTCSDTIVYDLATLINAWFYDGGQFDEYHFKIFFNQYFESISWSDDEKNYLNFYLKVSAIRFFLTRIHDQYFNKKGEVKHKDPLEFFDILNFHEKRNLQDFF